MLRAPVMAPASSAQRATYGRPMEPQETGKASCSFQGRGQRMSMPDPLDASVGMSDQRPQDKFGCNFFEKRRRGVGIPLAPSGPHGASWAFNYECHAEGERLRVAGEAAHSEILDKFGDVFAKSDARRWHTAARYGPQCASWAAASEEEALSLITGELSDVQLFPTNGRIRTEFVEGRRPAPPTRQT